MMKKILLLQESVNHDRCMVEYLESENFIVDCVYSVASGLRLIDSGSVFSAIIIHHDMNINNSSFFINKLRREIISGIPVLFLSLANDIDRKVSAFKLGVDDFLAYPCDFREIVIRLNALSVRGDRRDLTEISSGGLILNLSNDTLNNGESVIQLSKIHARIIKLLLIKSPNVVSRDELIEYVWGDCPTESDALRSHIYALRKTIGWEYASMKLFTVKRLGYQIICCREEA